MKARIDSPWRVNADDREGAFDEIVVGRWLHIERMTDRHYWMRVGDREFDVFARGHDGTVEVRERTP